MTNKEGKREMNESTAITTQKNASLIWERQLQQMARTYNKMTAQVELSDQAADCSQRKWRAGRREILEVTARPRPSQIHSNNANTTEKTKKKFSEDRNTTLIYQVTYISMLRKPLLLGWPQNCRMAAWLHRSQSVPKDGIFVEFVITGQT